MAEKRLALGKGLSALLGDGFSDKAIADTALEKIYLIKLQDIQPDPNQPRQHMDSESLESLAESIKQHGILQPLLLRSEPDGVYRIIAGERRWRAANLAGLTEAPCRVLTVSENDARELALIENIQRRDLTLMEIASALEAMIAKNGLTQEECAARLGWSRSTVANRLRLLSLSPEVLELLAAERISEGHARALLGVSEDQRLELALACADGAMTVRQLEEEIRRRNDPNLEVAEAKAETEVEIETGSKRFHALRLPRPLKALKKQRGIKIRVGRRDGAARIVLDDLQGIADEKLMQAIENCLRELYSDEPDNTPMPEPEPEPVAPETEPVTAEPMGLTELVEVVQEPVESVTESIESEPEPIEPTSADLGLVPDLAALNIEPEPELTLEQLAQPEESASISIDLEPTPENVNNMDNAEAESLS